MTPKEFKAWFEGFTEAMDGQPTTAQWAKVKERVAQIDGMATTYPVFVDRYVPRRYQEWWELPRVYGAAQSGAAVLFCNADASGHTAMSDVRFEPATAMRALGKVDYASEAAA